jgi:hypothetical protein
MEPEFSRMRNSVYDRARTEQPGTDQVKRRLALLLFAALTLAAGAAQATTQGLTVIQRWKAMDKCSRAAQLAYPDFTAEADAKRTAKLNDCLNANGLPPREPGR